MVAGTRGALDHLFSLPEKRRGFTAVTATPTGIEASAGWRLWDAGWSEGALGAWARTPWDEWNPTGGARLEIRF